KAPLKLNKSGIAANLNASPKASRYDRSTRRYLPDDEHLLEPAEIVFGLTPLKLEKNICNLSAIEAIVFISRVIRPRKSARKSLE
ncbi:MAG TPA: hypothetical protein PLY04_18240, partial [bacterium]|nr:hypothetical protein [bacterium]